MDRDPNNPDEKVNKLHAWRWQDFENWAQKTGENAEQLWIKTYYFDKQIDDLDRSREWYKAEEEEAETQMNRIGDEDMKKHYRNRLEHFRKVRQEMDLKRQELELESKNFQTINDYGLKKAAESYGQAGIWAWQESQKNKYVQHGKGSINVGPEMGWPQYYGSHPREFVELIKHGREEMVRKLTTEEKMSKSEAERLAKEHIKGELDTSHLGMWLQNFKPNLPWDKRVSEFKDWFKGQMEYLAEENKKHDIIGQIQVVDSATGAHGHLPPGQGILGKDIFEYMKILKEKGGYKGEFTSEGHEEEKFNQGRILTRAWQTLGSPIGTGYWHGRPQPQFVDVRHAYAQIAYGTTGIFQSYVPSNDFTLWSNVPLE
jgi:hypothetical protein